MVDVARRDVLGVAGTAAGGALLSTGLPPVAAMPAVRLDTLYERDALYTVWRDYFEDLLSICRDGE